MLGVIEFRGKTRKFLKRRLTLKAPDQYTDDQIYDRVYQNERYYRREEYADTDIKADEDHCQINGPLHIAGQRTVESDG
jgi:hypothetical protein